MNDTPIPITTNLGKILERIELKIDDLQKDVTAIKWFSWQFLIKNV